MGLGDFFGKINEKMNAVYDKLVAFLDEKGIPAQKYTDFLEEKGIPAMWFTILMIAVIITVIVLLVTIIFTPSVNLAFSFLTDDGTAPSSVFLNITNATGEILFSEQIQSGTSLKIKGVGTGDSLFISSTLEGYVFKSPFELSIAEKNTNVTLVFAKEQKTGKVSFKVINSDEQTSISNAKISFYDSESLLASGTTDEFGSYDAVLALKKIVVEVDKDGYESYKKTIDLLDGGEYMIELSSKEFDPNEEGSFKFIVKDIMQNSLNNVKIDVYNLKTNSKIGSVNTNSDGVAIFNTRKGTSIRFVASKEGFEVFDSNVEGILRTLVTSEELVSISMFAGGGKLKVIVTDSLGVTLDNAYVGVYTSMFLEQLTQTTDIGGVVEFSGLDYTIIKYVSVYREGYYPQTKEVSESGEITFKLEKVDLATAAIVDIYAIDESKKPVGNAKVDLAYVDENAETKPLAYPNALTSVTGYLNVNLKPGITLYASATTDEKYGESSLLLKQGRNRIDISMKYLGSKFSAYLYGKDGNPLANAHVMLFDKQGNLVFDGYTDENGKFEADALGNKDLDMVVTDADGNVYSQSITPKDKQQIKLEENKNKDKLLVSLSKVTDLDGVEVSAMQKGKTYFLIFNVFWPDGFYKGGLHVRVGDDSEKYAVSQDVGIVGFDGLVDDYKYGITYSPVPAPGDYSTDSYSSGSAGQFNKWFETYFASPSGTTTIKVRVKTKTTTDVNSIDVRYRAWIDSETGFTRTPADAALGSKENVKSKFGLYADSFVKTISLVSGSMNCQYDLCTSYKIVDDKFTYDIAKFNAVLDYYYALDVELTSTSEQEVSVSAQTEEDKKIHFNNFEYASELFSPGTEQNGVLNAPVTLGSMEKKIVRFYFNPFKEGLTYLVIKSITSKGIIEKKITVNIFPKKEMSVTLSAEFIPIGEDFFAIVKEGSNYITNAKLTITNKKTQKPVSFVEGNGTVDAGKDGRYVVKNNLESGYYLLTVDAPGYLPTELEFLIGNVGALFVKGDNEIIIPKGTKMATQKIPVQNKSKLPIESITVNITSSTLSSDFAFSAKMVTGAIQANSAGDLAISVAYSGQEEMNNGVVELEIVGVQNKKEITRVKTKVFVYYNKEIKSTSCLWVSKEALVYSLPAIANSKTEDSIVVRNNCEYDLKVIPQLISEDASNYGIQLQMQGFDIKKGEEKAVKFTLINQNPSIYTDESKTLSLYLTTDYFTKNIPVTITIWNASGSLSIMTAGHVFLSSFNELQGQYVPVIIQNVGRLPIYNIQTMASNNRYQMQSYNYGFNNYNYNNNNQYLSSYSQLNQNRYNQGQYNNWRNNYGVTPNSYPLNSYPYSSQYGTGYNSGYDYGNQYPYNYGISQDYYSNPWNYQDQYNSIYNNPSYGSYTYGGQGINFIPSTTQVLMPGQSAMLQGYIIMPTSSKQTEMYYQIMARGTIEGINQPVTAQGYLVIHVSPDKCITLKKDTKLTFISETLDKDIARTFTLINNCAEPVNITGISEQDIFGNKISMSAPTGVNIDVGQEKEFIMTVKASKEISRDNTLFVKGTYGMSNNPFNVPITVNLRFGGGASTATGEAAVSEEKRVKNCTTGEEVTLFYPKITNADCSLMGYCDSESMSKFIIAKLKYYLELYNKKLSTTNYKLQNSNCQVGSESCSFEDFGLEPLELYVYFSNDKLTDVQMNADLKKSNIGLIETAITDKVVLTDVTSTWTKKLYLDKLLDGCGKYKLRITGAVQVINNDVIQKDSYNMYVEVLEKEKTPQCDLKVQNAINYLPKDAQTKKDNPYGLKIGHVDYETQDLAGLADRVSKSLFNQDRYLKSKTNTLYLKRDSVNEGNLVELTIEQKGTDIITTVKVNKNLDIGNEAIANDMVKAIMGFLYGNFDGCVTVTGDGVPNAAQVKSGKGGVTGKNAEGKEVFAGDIKLGMCDRLPLGVGKWACNVQIESQNLGRVDLVLTYPENTGLEGYIDSKGQKTKTIELTKQGNKYAGAAKIFVEITDPYKVNAGANSDSTGVFYYAEREGVKTEPIRLQFDPACGITAKMFISQMMEEIGNNDQGFNKYALIYEPGVGSANTCKTLENFIAEGSSIGKNNYFGVLKGGAQKYAMIDYEGCNLQQKSIVGAITSNSTDPVKLGAASAAGMAACVLVEKGASRLLLMGPLGLGAAAIDCGIFTGINVATELYGAHRMNAEAGLTEKNWVDSLHDGLASVPILSTVLGLEDYSNLEEKIAEAKEEQTWFSAGSEGVEENAGEQTIAATLLALRTAKPSPGAGEVKPGETTPTEPTPEPVTTPPEEVPPTTQPEPTTPPEATTPTEPPVQPTFDEEALEAAKKAKVDADADLVTKKVALEEAKGKVTAKTQELSGVKAGELAAANEDLAIAKDAAKGLEKDLANLEKKLASNPEMQKLTAAREAAKVKLDVAEKALTSAEETVVASTETAMAAQEKAMASAADEVANAEAEIYNLNTKALQEVGLSESEKTVTQKMIGSAKQDLENALVAQKQIANNTIHVSTTAVDDAAKAYDAAAAVYDDALATEKKLFESLSKTEGENLASNLAIAKDAEASAKDAVSVAKNKVTTLESELKMLKATEKSAAKSVTTAEAAAKSAATKVSNLEAAKTILLNPGLTNAKLSGISQEMKQLEALVKQAREYKPGTTERLALGDAIEAQAQKINTMYRDIEPSLKNMSKTGGKAQAKSIMKAYSKLGLADVEKNPHFWQRSLGERLIRNNNLSNEIDGVTAAIKAKVSGPAPVTAAESATTATTAANTAKASAAQTTKAAPPAKAKGPSKVKKFGSGVKNFMKGMIRSVAGGGAGTFAFYAMLDHMLATSKLDLVTIKVEAPQELLNYSNYVGEVSPYTNNSRLFKIYDGADKGINGQLIGETLDSCNPLGESKGFKEATGKTTTQTGSGVVGGAGFKSEPTSYDDLIIKAANNAGMEPELLKAILKYESGFDASDISSTGCTGLGQICMSSAQKPYIMVQCTQKWKKDLDTSPETVATWLQQERPRQCDLDTCKDHGSYIWCDPCTSNTKNCVPDDRFDPEKNLMSSALTIKGKINSVGDCGKDKVMAWAAAYNMGESWVKKAIAKNGGNCNDWPNETWYKLKEVQEESGGDLTYKKIELKKGDFTNGSNDYVAKIYNAYLGYKNSGIDSGDSKVANTAPQTKSIEDCSQILLVGDSITDGYSSSFKKYCPEVEVCAESGKSTTWMVGTCFTNEKLANKKYLIILGGVNNIDTPTKVQSDLTQMYSIAASKGISVIALTILPWKGDGSWNEQNQQNTLNVNDFIKSQQLDGILDTYSIFNDGDGALKQEYAASKLHLNSTGNEALASQVYSKLVELTNAGSGTAVANNGSPLPPG